MNRLFDSIAIEGSACGGFRTCKTGRIDYEFCDSDEAKPYVKIEFALPLPDGEMADFELDIPRDDMVDLLNEVIDEWPDIVECSPVKVRRGVKTIPIFC